ncbi:hypothetical protein DFQ27_006906 [Actinomortierella ambigua]|uniref:Uncharacterized protein n=1 Tax=Actinomortierella ambigua TaxID=1343610 RepID=A0A9P6U0V3_9FUNG|nr:hypothetical protein DFQ27_006906 [Actinomortierella ambigua]
MGQSSSLSSDSGLEAKLFLDPVTFTVHNYILNEHNVSQMFHRYQIAVAKTVNNFDVSATLRNIPYFLYAYECLLPTTMLPSTPELGGHVP